MINYCIPILILTIILIGIIEKKNVYELFIAGAKEGLKTVYTIFPYIFAIMIISGLLNDTGILKHVSIFGFNGRLIPLILMKPLSGGASTSIILDIFKNDGPDSFIGMVASILMAATETTLYVISILASKINVKDTRIVIISGLIGDLATVILTLIIVNYI